MDLETSPTEVIDVKTLDCHLENRGEKSSERLGEEHPPGDVGMTQQKLRLRKEAAFVHKSRKKALNGA